MPSDSHNPLPVSDQCEAFGGIALCEKAKFMAEGERLREALLWIRDVNAMDYEYRQIAREALEAGER